MSQSLSSVTGIAVEVHMLDGSCHRGELVENFNPAQKSLQIRNHNSVEMYPTQQLAYIIFYDDNEKNASLSDKLVHEEEVQCIDGQYYHIRSLPNHYIRQGFFAFSASPTLSQQRYYFSFQGIRQRIERKPEDSAKVEQEKTSAEDVTFLPLARPSSAISSEQILERIGTGKKSALFKRVGDILCSAGVISEVQLQQALNIQKDNRNTHLGRILIEHGFVSEEQLLTALALKFQLRFIHLSEYPHDSQALEMISSELAQQLQVFPVELRNHETLVVATSEPTNGDIADTLRFHSGKKIELVIALSQEIRHRLAQYYTHHEDDIAQLLIENERLIDEPNESIHQLETEAAQTPIVRLGNRIMLDAVERKASDIHIFSNDGMLYVLFRIDGVYREAMHLDMQIQRRLMTRFKIISGMDITERRLPQDGYIRLSLPRSRIEMRVSCLPGVSGESMVLRIFDIDGRPRQLNELGFSSVDCETIRTLLHTPAGMLLVTGATGSGKSATLTSMINSISDRSKHIISLEDPVEIQLSGVDQIPMNESIGLTFARALRNVLRHDPDVIMLGEIRDEETAHIAVQAAMTGHLLISTLHTNDASSTFVRLLDMGIKPYLVASTIKGVIAQRLLPSLCPHCRIKRDLMTEEKSYLEHANIPIIQLHYVFDSEGCEHCDQTGIYGRILINELLVMTPDIHRLIIEQVSKDEIFLQAHNDGMQSLMDQAVLAASQGKISLKTLISMQSL